MARTGPSAADRQIISQLAERDLSVSPAQLERWRQARLLPRNSRHGRGRGRGSVSGAAPEAAEVAAALARHARQGRDLRWVAIDWFAEAGMKVRPAEPVVPEPPFTAVRSALKWIIARSPDYRLLKLGRAARTDQEQDDFYQAAGRAMRSVAMAPALDVTAAREALGSRQEIPDEAFRKGPEVRSALIQLTAATTMGYEEVGAGALAEAFAESGMIPGMPPAAIQQVLTELEAAGTLAAMPITQVDPLQMVSRANAEHLQQARTAVRTLAYIGGMFLFHALLMPDTPGQKELRTTVTAMGMQPIAMATALSIHTTEAFASAIVSCLHPSLAEIHKVLSEAASRPLIADNTEDAEKHMAAWRTALHQATGRRASLYGRDHAVRRQDE
jgi:hypothetical protein